MTAAPPSELAAAFIRRGSGAFSNMSNVGTDGTTKPRCWLSQKGRKSLHHEPTVFCGYQGSVWRISECPKTDWN
jgi:hypothetical protein